MKRFFRCAAALLLLVCLLGITPRAKALNRYLRVGLNPNTPPFQVQQADGTCAGMHVDMLTAIAEADNFEIEFVPFETDKACLEALRDGEIDLVLGEIATKANSTGDFCVTDSLTSSQLCVIVANDMLQSGKSARTAICVSDTIQHTLLANQPDPALPAPQGAAGLGNDRRQGQPDLSAGAGRRGQKLHRTI